MAIKLKGLLTKFRLGGKSAPGKGEGQDYIDHNGGGSFPAQQSWDFNPAT
jgi:hypothetical protein